MKSVLLLVVLSITTFLTACGGGGESNSGASIIGTPNNQTYMIEGFAAKGTLKYATVELYRLDSKGSETLVYTVETRADGTYKIYDLISTAGQKYIIKIRSNVRTIHDDETTNNKLLPSTFEMSAITQTDSITTTASVTPFSNMIVEAARKAAGGLSDANNISKAQSTVTEMLGFNPTIISKNDGVSVEAQKMSILLTAVSQMAKDNSLNCGATPGERTACVVKKLGEAATTTSLKMEATIEGTKVNVANKLATAVNTTIANNPSLESAIVAQAISKLSCTANCSPAVAQDTTTVSDIGKVKAVFDEIRTDLKNMFSSDGVTSSSKGKANLQAFKFQQSFESVKLSTDQVDKDFAAIQAGIDLYNNYKNQAGSPVTANLNYGDFSYTSGLNAYSYASLVCTLYQTEPIPNTTSTAATVNGKNANYVGCSSIFSWTITPNNLAKTNAYESYRRSFVLVPSASGSFTYKMFSRKITYNCPFTATTCTTSVTEFLGNDARGNNMTYSGAHQGSINPSTRNSNGVTSYTLSGDLAPGFQYTPKTTGAANYVPVSLARNDGKDSWNLNIQATENLTTTEITKLVLSGNVSSFNGVGTKISEIAINNGSNIDRLNYSGLLDLSFSATSGTTTSSLSGVLKAGTPVTDKSGNRTIPSKINFTGTFSNAVSGGIPINFLQGAIDVEIKNYNTYDVRFVESLTNTPTQVITFTGSVTAPDQPKLEILLSTTGKSFNLQDTAMAAELAYNRYSGDVKNRTVTISLTRTSTTSAKRVSLIESTSGLSISFLDSDSTALVKVNGVEIGTWDLSSGLVTFKDGSVVSLDINV